MAQATLKGKVKWFQYLNPPRENKYKPIKIKGEVQKDEMGRPILMKEWSTMLSVDSAIKQFLRQNKVKKSVKYDDELEDYINLTLDATDKKGEVATKPAAVLDTEGNTWPADKWIGHGSTVEVTVEVKKYDFKDNTGSQVTGASLVPLKFVIIDHVPYTKPDATKTTKQDTTNWSEE